jgi:hypothetical protein
MIGIEMFMAGVDDGLLPGNPHDSELNMPCSFKAIKYLEDYIQLNTIESVTKETILFLGSLESIELIDMTGYILQPSIFIEIVTKNNKIYRKYFKDKGTAQEEVNMIKSSL